MKKTEANITITKTISALEQAFDKLNERFYEGKLKRPVITINEGSKVHAYGWFVCKEVWHEGNNSACELTVCGDYLNRDLVEIVTTLMHEMVHCYCYANEIKDCSRRGAYHNKTYRDEACNHGMYWRDEAPCKKYGYYNVGIKEELVEEIMELVSFLKEAITVYREETQKGERKVKTKSNTIKYMCMGCNASFRATSEINCICGSCNVPFLPVV